MNRFENKVAIVTGASYPGPVMPRLIPCSDAAGEVMAAGEGVTAYKPGDRVVNTFHPQ